MANEIRSEAVSDEDRQKVVTSVSGWKFWIVPKDYAVFVATNGLWGENSLRLVEEAMRPCCLTKTRTFSKVENGGKKMTGIGYNFPSDDEDVKAETIKHICRILKEYNP